MDQLYNGQNRSLQLASVRLILDSMMPELQKDPNKRFVYVEVRLADARPEASTDEALRRQALRRRRRRLLRKMMVGLNT